MSQENQFQVSHTPFDFTRYEKPYEIRRVKILKDLIPSGYGKTAIDIGCSGKGSDPFSGMDRAEWDLRSI